MSTAWSVYCGSTGGFQVGTTYVNLKAAVSNILPQARETVPIAMVHDPVNVLRANAALGFGRVVMSAEDNRAGAALIHELGHSIGNLADEYLYETTYGPPPTEPNRANHTINTDPATVKWAEFIKGNPPVPTPNFYDGYGFFEGGGSYDRGVYRPTENSMMRSTVYPFFEVNVRQLSIILSQFQ